MGFGLGMLVAVTSVLTVTFPASGMTSGMPMSEIEIINHVLFDLDLVTFTRHRSSFRRTYPQLDWTTDGCSAPVVGNSGRSFNFRSACIRHDFGYRNYKARGVFTTETRTRIDNQFRRDLDASCTTKLRTFKMRCLAWAEIFFSAVRLAGGP